MQLFSNFVTKSCSVILSLLKYQNEHANENTKRGTKNAPQGILFIEEAFAMKCNNKTLAKECQKVRDGKSDLRKSAKRCGYSLRQFRRKYSEFLSKGESSFVHGNKGKSSARRLSEDVRKAIIEDYSRIYPSFNFTHFYEKIEDKYNVSRTAVYRILADAGFRSPMCQRRKRRKEKGN